MNGNINVKRLKRMKRRNMSQERARVEIEKLINSTVNENGDEAAQFLANGFISEQFCMLWEEEKNPKQNIKRVAETVAIQVPKECSVSQKIDDNHIRRESATAEDADRQVSNTPQNPLSDESKNEHFEVKKKALDILLKESYEAYHLGQYCLAATKYKLAWEMIADASLKPHFEHVNQDVVCYLLCLSLLETDQLNNLLEAVELLISLEKRSSQTFPAVYYALSKAHHKHYRFQLALNTISQGLALLKSGVELKEYMIPGSNVTLKESTRDGLLVSLVALEDECSKWHPPDAICCMGECLPSSRWYGPCRDIYFSDPAFNGMVVLTCSNARNRCTIKYHQYCWKAKKDQLPALKKLSDKDIIGLECFTPNCECAQGVRSLIAGVEVYGADGKLKTRIEPSANSGVWTKKRSSLKGAIPKQPVKPKRPTEKIRRPSADTTPKSSSRKAGIDNRAEKERCLVQLAKLRKNNFGIRPDCEWRPDVKMYGNSQMIEIGDFLGGPIFENERPELAEVKTFVFTYFYEFIKENGCMKKKEILQKWAQDQFIVDNHSDIFSAGMDICEFLLQSYKLVSIGDYISTAENLPELYATARNEVCSCLRFLLNNSVKTRASLVQSNISNPPTNHYEEAKPSSLTAVVDDHAKMVQLSISLELNFETNDCQGSENGGLLGDPVTENICSEAADLEEPLALPITCDDKVEPVDSTALVEISEGDRCSGCSEDDIYCSEGGFELEAQVVEAPRVDSEEATTYATCDSQQDFNHELNEGIDSMQKTTTDDSRIADTGFVPKDSEDDKEDCVSSTENELSQSGEKEATSFSSLGRDAVGAEGYVEKVENEPAITSQAIAELKSVLAENKAVYENQLKMLKLEFKKYKTVAQESMSELVKDLSGLEVRCAEIESRKSDIMKKYEKCKLDLRESSEECVLLTLKNTELMYKQEKINEEKNDTEHNLDLLIKEKSAIENELEILRRERDEIDESLLKYQARLKDKSLVDLEPMFNVREGQSQSEQRILDIIKLSERRLKQQSLNHEFSINMCALEKKYEKCCDYINMLQDVGKLVSLITAQQFVVTEAEAAWQNMRYHLPRTIQQYKADYSRLEALLESDDMIENLNEINLPTLNIVLPQPPRLIELYQEGKAKFIHHKIPLPPPPWGMQRVQYPDPRYCIPLPQLFYRIENSDPRVNGAQNVSVSPRNYFPRQFHPSDNSNNSSHHMNQSDDLNGAASRSREHNVKQESPSFTDSQNLNSADQHCDSSPSHDAEKNNAGLSIANSSTASSNGNENEAISDKSVPGRSNSPKKIGRDLLMQELRKKFVGVPEYDLLESVEIVRRSHNGTLSGMRVQDIIKESEPFIKKRQAKYMVDYSPSTEMPPPEKLANKLVNLKTTQPVGQKLNQTTDNPKRKDKNRAITQEEVNKLVNYSTKNESATVSAFGVKPPWRLVTSRRVDWQNEFEDSECSICYENMNANDSVAPVYALPCQHSFHTLCIKKWLKENSICPQCRRHCTMDDEFPPLGS